MLGCMYTIAPEARPLDLTAFRQHFNPSLLQTFAFLVERKLVGTTLKNHLFTDEWRGCPGCCHGPAAGCALFCWRGGCACRLTCLSGVCLRSCVLS